MGANLHQASSQWAYRPADERFWTLRDMRMACDVARANSAATRVSMSDLEVQSQGDELVLVAHKGYSARFSHYAFGQFAGSVGAPAGYLRELPPRWHASSLLALRAAAKSARYAAIEPQQEATMDCKHKHTRCISTYCFSGPVSADENRAAHGGITDTDECLDCGARRRTNVNFTHVEVGDWGPSKRERVESAREAVRLAPLPQPLVCGELHACVDEAGYVILTGRHRAGDERTLPATWIAAAQRRRMAVSALEAEVQS